MTLKTRPCCLKYSLIPLFLLFFQPLRAQPDFSDVDVFLQRNQKALGTAAVVVFKDGKTVYTKANDDLFNAKTQAPVPGLSNWFTAALVLTFVDEGKIKLDDPIGKYLPVMEKYMKGYVTIRQCLAHTTGIENEKGSITRIFEKKKFDMLEETVNAYAAKEISNNAGTEFHYGNIGPTIAGRVLEIVSKKSFDRLAQERLFRPMKMRSSTFVDFSGRAVNPATGAQSSANDIINFLSMLLNKGAFEGKRILSEASVAEMLKPQFTDLPIKYTPEFTAGLHHGLGVWLEEEDAKGQGIVATGFALFGTYAYVDMCRQYATVLFLQKPVKEMRKELTRQFHNIVEGQMGECR